MSPDAARFEQLPPPAPAAPERVLAELGDGLVLRCAGPDDAEALAAFNRVVHADAPDFAPAEAVAHWTRDLFASRHPQVAPEDFWLVQDTRRRRVASSLVLISHRLRYGDVAFAGGQPELVGTHPDYRRRGLVRRLFGALHAESARRGQQLLLIDGIPWYYRQFGYEMALDMNVAQQCDGDQLPVADPDSARLRPVAPADLPLVAKLYEQGCARSRLSCVRDDDVWRYQLNRQHPESEGYRALWLLESAQGDPLAFAAARSRLRQGLLVVTFCELAAGAPGGPVARQLLGELAAEGRRLAARDGAAFKALVLALGGAHPLYELLRGRTRPGPPGYAFYVRVPDPAEFLRTIAPELERRLATSAFAGHSGAVDLSLYRSGLRLRLEGGRVAGVETWTPDTDARGDLAFPGLSFVQLLTGQRSLAELEAFFPDCLVWNEDRGALVDALFPRQPTNLWLGE